jgi:predicted RNA binding protein YcfA (HicA-like mRNA interferase family)
VDRAAERRRLAQRPNNVRFEELRRVLEAYGWRLDRISGSHHVFERGGARFSVPIHGGKVKPVYVRQALRWTADEAGETGKGDEGENDDGDDNPK